MSFDRYMRFRRTGRAGQSPPSSGPGLSPEPIAELLKNLLEELQRRKEATPPRRDWVQTVVTALPSLVAAMALVLTWLSLNTTTRATNHQLQAANAQLRIAEQGQITDRYTAAITNLGSSKVDVRLGGVYALQRIMHDSSRDQPTVVAVLCAFVRNHANSAGAGKVHPSAPPRQALDSRFGPSTDIQAALTVVGDRDRTHDGSKTIIDFTNTDLADAYLPNVNLSNANFFDSNLAGSYFYVANLYNIAVDGANLTGATFIGADLSGVIFNTAKISGAKFEGANLSDSYFQHMDLSGINFTDVNLNGAYLNGSDFKGADLVNVNFTGADPKGANLTGANLTDANLTGANLTGVDLKGAKLTDTKGLPPDA